MIFMFNLGSYIMWNFSKQSDKCHLEISYDFYDSNNNYENFHMIMYWHCSTRLHSKVYLFEASGGFCITQQTRKDDREALLFTEDWHRKAFRRVWSENVKPRSYSFLFIPDLGYIYVWHSYSLNLTKTGCSWRLLEIVKVLN